MAIYSVLGGVALQIQRELHPAAHWPAERPHFE
jgi:hypothetical protein